MSDSMQQLGNDVKAPTNETMTLTRMVDIWSRMTPEQKEFVAILHADGFGVATAVSCGGPSADFYEECYEGYIDKSLWDKLDLPYKFGALNGRRTTT